MPKITRFESAFTSYEVIEVLGEGGAGRVYKVQDESGKPFALKHLHPDRVTQEKVKRFKNELFFCSQNVHPNIVEVLDWGFVNDSIKSPFYVPSIC